MAGITQHILTLSKYTMIEVAKILVDDEEIVEGMAGRLQRMGKWDTIRDRWDVVKLPWMKQALLFDVLEDVVRENMTARQVLRSVEVDKNFEVMGVSGEDLREVSGELPVDVLSMVEERLGERCQRLTEFMGVDGDVARVVRERVDRLEREKEALRRDEVENELLAREYHQALADVLVSTGDLIERHQLNEQLKRDEALTSWLAARSHAVSLKLEYV